MLKENYEVMAKILFAVETGGQIYGKADWDCVVGAGHNTPNEKAITIGAAGWYANNAKKLLNLIRSEYPNKFRELDIAGISADLDNQNWSRYAIPVPSTKSRCIQNIIGCQEGINCQYILIIADIENYERNILTKYGSMCDGAMMECVNITHQGGAKALERILNKTARPLTQHTIYAALKTDLQDTSNNNQVGDYKSRQLRVYEMINEHCQEGESMSRIEKATQWMEQMARDDSHGYDQTYRWGQKGDWDCSAAVIQAWETAGVPVKTAGASYTGNIKPVFLKKGFKDVTRTVNLSNGSGLIRGDVLLHEGHHVAMYCGNGKEVEASINEKGTITGGKPGDQTGREFLIQPYRNHPWTCVLRYPEEPTVATVNVATGQKGLVTTCNLNVRTAPVDGTVIGTLAEGTATYPVQRTYGDWWFKNKDGWYSGKHLTGWVQDQSNGQWWYLEEGIALYNCWKQINGDWFWFNADGYIATGWKQIGDVWYYFNKYGVMQTGWQLIDNKWYFMDDNGHMLHDQWAYNTASKIYYWLKSDGSWDGKTIDDPDQWEKTDY